MIPTGPIAGQWIINRLVGDLPNRFNRDRTKTTAFMEQWHLYHMTNLFNIQMATPYQHVILCLGYIKGDKVTYWVANTRNWLQDTTTHIVNPILTTSMWLWNTFKQDFRNTFEDLAMKQRGEREWLSLKIKNNELDIYVTTFMELAKMVR